jgi:hypothetical protein
MLKKTTVSVGLAAAASAGVLLFTGSPASAQTIPAQNLAAYGQTTGTSPAERHWRGHEDDIRGHWWGNEWGENWRHHRRHHVHHRGWSHHGHHRDWTKSHNTSHHVVIKSTNVTKVSVGG